ncbi:MAG: glycyl-radical enzyme activating protein, partial [Clostridiales bacterium]|nr:glycyl-radical enzyme activating protein [Clostridiales bacterium]
MKGQIFNIQRFSIHDGPGIRTTVFFKGCSLRCLWCHNPESIAYKPQLQFFPQKCIGCGKCVEVCPAQAHTYSSGNRVFKRELCKSCGSCADTCYAEALVISGICMEADEVMQEIEKDSSYYLSSGGGVTFSGGEALLQKDFLKELLIKCKKRNFHTTVDTAGNVPWDNFEAVLPYVDLFLYDIKTFSEDKHKEATGAGNERILENLSRLSGAQTEIWVRIPVVPGINDSYNEMESISDFIAGLKHVSLVELMSFHH